MVQVGQKALESALGDVLDNEFVDVKLSDMKREVVDACVHDNNCGRSTDETRRVLQALQTGEKCPLDWVPGEATLW